MKKLTEDQVKIMGRPCFACANVAKLLIAGGVYEDKAKKAEYEQAVFIDWALGLLAEHGDDWGKEGDKILRQIAQEMAAKLETDQPETEEA